MEPLILARKLVKDGADASPDAIAYAKENIAHSIAEKHKKDLRGFYSEYSELSIFLYCLLALVLALVAIGLMGGVIAALSSVAPPVMAILVLSPQTLATVFFYSFSALTGVFGLSFLLKRPFLWSAKYRAQILYQQALKESIDNLINKAVGHKLKGELDDFETCRDRVLRLQARMKEESPAGFFAKIYATLGNTMRTLGGRSAPHDPEYFDACVEANLWERYTRVRQALVGSLHASRTVRYLEPYTRLGFGGIGQPNYKQVVKTLTGLHRRLYLLDKEIISSSLEPDPSKLDKRKMYAELVREQEGLRRQVWYDSIPIIGGLMGWLRKGLVKLGVWPNNLTENNTIWQIREAYLEKSCLHLLGGKITRKWGDLTITWALEEKPLWSMPRKGGIFGLHSLPEQRQVTREEYHAAQKAFIAFLQQDSAAYDGHVAALQKLGGEEWDSKAYMTRYTKSQLLRWLRILSSDDNQGGEGTQESHADFEAVFKMCPGNNSDEKETFLREKLAEIEDVGFWHKFLVRVGWRRRDSITRSKLAREQKEDALITSRISKASKNLASLALQEDHLEDIERWRLKKILGKTIPDEEKIDYETLGLYRPEEIEKIAEDFNNTNYFSYLYQVFYILSATKLHKTLDVYECKLSCQMVTYGELDDEHKKLLKAMDTVREKLKKDENMDIFRDAIYPFTLLQGLFAALASSMVEPLFGGGVLTTVSAAGLVNNMRTKGRRDVATLGFVTTMLLGISIITIQSVLLAGVTFSGAAVAVGVIATIGGTLSFATWVVRGAKRSIDSEKNINPRISMATRKGFALAIELDEASEKDEAMKKWMFDESVTQEEARTKLKKCGIESGQIAWLLKKRDQFHDAKGYIRLLCRQQTNLIRTIKNGINKDTELSIITERCKNIARAYHNSVLSEEAATSMLQPLLHAKTVQQNHTNRNYLYLWVSMPAVTMGFIALSSIIFPVAPILLATILVMVQITAIGVFSLIHLHQYRVGSKGMFYQEEPSAKDYLHDKEKKSLTIRKEDYDMVRIKHEVLAGHHKKGRGMVWRRGLEKEKNSSLGEIEIVDKSKHTNQNKLSSNEVTSDKRAPNESLVGHGKNRSGHKHKGNG